MAETPPPSHPWCRRPYFRAHIFAGLSAQQTSRLAKPPIASLKTGRAGPAVPFLPRPVPGLCIAAEQPPRFPPSISGGEGRTRGAPLGPAPPPVPVLISRP